MEKDTKEIPKERWRTYLRQIADRQRGRPVRVEVVGLDEGDQTITARAQLKGMALESAPGKRWAVGLDLGVEGRTDHRVLWPAHVFARQGAAGEVECLDFEDSQRTKTLVHFQHPLLLTAGRSTKRSPRPEITVRETMASHPKTILSGSSCARAQEIFLRHSIRHLPVLDDHSRLVGVLSERDLCLGHAGRDAKGAAVIVDEVMSRFPYRVAPDTRLDEAAAVMANRKYGCAVVVDRDRVVGILTTTDALRALVKLRAEERGDLS